MVISYSDNNKIMILDNLMSEIKSSEERKDLTPVFSFNDEAIYTELNSNKINKSLSKWQEVNEKTRKEVW